MYFDTHCHLDHRQFDGDRDAVFARAVAANVTRFVNPAYDLESSRRAIDMARQHDNVMAAVGVHPNDLGDLDDTGLTALRTLSQQPKVIAIGEIGLDYHWNTFPKTRQAEGFTQQLQLAQERGLPVLIHCRDAYDDLLDLLDANKSKVRILLHSFAGSMEHAERALSMGCTLGIGGPITYKNGTLLRQVVEATPLSQLVLETDAPYLAPHPHRGKRNEPSYLPLMADQVARMHNIDIDDVGLATMANALRFFGLT
jgi:TatD DNase family protein